MSDSSTFVLCRGCGHHIYYGARRCPICRRRIRLTASERLMITITVLVAVGGACAAWLMANT